MKRCWKCTISDAWNWFLGIFRAYHFHPSPPRPPEKCDHCGVVFQWGDFRMNVLPKRDPNTTVFGPGDPIVSVDLAIERWCLHCAVNDPLILSRLQGKDVPA